MNFTYIKFFLIPLLLCGLDVKGQNNTGCSGGDKVTKDYTVSYSVGQCLYTAVSQSGYYISSGEQHPMITVSTNSDLDNRQDNLNVIVFPIPVKDKLYLKVTDSELKGLSYLLLDVNGKVIDNNIINQSLLIISMDKCNRGNYFLKIVRNNRELKVFKIIKN